MWPNSEKPQLYPGYAVASYDPALQGGLTVNGTFLNYTKEQVLTATEISLLHRGDGTGPDADAGWEKVWRAAGWAQLGNEREFYKALTVCVPICFRFVFLTIVALVHYREESCPKPVRSL